MSYECVEKRDGIPMFAIGVDAQILNQLK